MNKLLKFLPAITIFILVVIFFNKTLTGNEIFATPDYGGSDILYIEYPSKLFISESLKSHQIPFWNSQIATGFPYLALPTGVANPINLIIFYFLPMPMAFNIGLASIFLTTGFFTYLFCRSLALSRLSSTIGSITFTFSGIFATEIIHFSVIQTLSYFPLELYLVESYLTKKKLYIPLILSLVIGVQILTGFYQVILYSLIFIVLYTFARIFYQKSFQKEWPIIISSLAAAIVAALLIGAVQLLPSWEFTKLSTRSEGVTQEEVKLFPYPVKHLITFISPYFFGDPRAGTYPAFSENWGIFWENTGYVGILPLIFALVAIIWDRKKYKHIIAFSALAAITLLLMLGKNSPLFLLFQFPPLSAFRVPARWIMFFTFSISILSAFGFETIINLLKSKIKLSNPNFIFIAILILATVDVFFFSINYNLRVPKDWLDPPQTAQFLKQDQSFYRIDSGKNAGIWNYQFLKNGWAVGSQNYLTFLNSLDPNWNLVHDINHVSLYAIIQTKRNQLINQIRDQNVRGKKDNTFVIDAAARNLVDMQNVKYLVSPAKFEGRDLTLVYSTGTNPPYYIFQNETVMDRAFIVSNWEYAKTPKEQYEALASNDFDPRKKVILETIPQTSRFKVTNSRLSITKYTDQIIEIEASLDGKGILVLADSFYPAWHATVDGQKTEILPANIDQRAIILEAGNHLVKFTYESETFKKGLLITTATSSILLLGLFILIFREKKFNYIHHQKDSSKNSARGI